MITAIEAYNRPDHKYREETFSILALNSWELLFKAKILAETRNDLRALYVYESRQLRGGGKSKRKFIRRNRAGNPMTIGLRKTLDKIVNERLGSIDSSLRHNLEALEEIRNNSVHLINIHPGISKALQELGAATVQNYVLVASEWFSYDFSQYNFYLMPLAFFRDFKSASAIVLTKEEENIAKYLSILSSKENPSVECGYSVTLELEVKLKRSDLPAAVQLTLGNNPDAIPVTLTEEDLRPMFPWDYEALTTILRKRYSDFKCNKAYHSIRKKLINDKRYVNPRYLDPGNKKSSKKDFYSRNILNEFDKYYTRS